MLRGLEVGAMVGLKSMDVRDVVRQKCATSLPSIYKSQARAEAAYTRRCHERVMGIAASNVEVSWRRPPSMVTHAYQALVIGADHEDGRGLGENATGRLAERIQHCMCEWGDMVMGDSCEYH